MKSNKYEQLRTITNNHEQIRIITNNYEQKRTKTDAERSRTFARTSYERMGLYVALSKLLMLKLSLS